MLEKSLQEIHDEIEANYSHQDGFTDKGLPWHTYIPYYEEELKEYRNGISLLEIGVRWGGSLHLWRHYFKSYEIVGIDIAKDPIKGFPFEQILRNDINITLFFGKSSTDLLFSKTIPSQIFDVIIDDGAHDVKTQFETFKLYWNKVKIGGKYFIEDVLGPSELLLLKNSIISFLQETGDKYIITEYTGNPSKLIRLDDLILKIVKE